MKLRIFTYITAITLLAALTLPTRCPAQEHNQKLPRYTVQDLGTLGGTYSLAGGLSNSGWVAGYSTLSGGTDHAVLWRNGKITNLGTLGGPNSDAGWRPNYAGNAAGGAETGAVDPDAENFCSYGDSLICLPFFWWNSTKKMTALPTLGGNNGWAAGVNDWDQVVGVAENTITEPTCAGTTQVFQFEPVLWIKGRIRQLPTFPGDPVGQAYSINDWGQATGYSGNCTEAFHALLWQNGVATDLGNLGGTMNNNGIDLNSWGQVVGGSDLLGDTTYHAFLWQNGVMTDLGTLPGDVGSEGDGINDWGQIVGGSYDASGNSRAYLWQNGAMTDLNTLIPSNSPLYLLWASGTINDQGQIAGYALQISTGETHAFLATPGGWQAFGESAAPSGAAPKITLPENVRKLLQQRARFGRLKGGLVRPQ